MGTIRLGATHQLCRFAHILCQIDGIAPARVLAYAHTQLCAVEEHQQKSVGQ